MVQMLMTPDFFTSLSDHSDNTLIIGGDFNMVSDSGVDTQYFRKSAELAVHKYCETIYEWF